MKKILICSAVIICIIISVSYFFWGRSEKTVADYFVIKKGDVSQVVSVTGKVKPVSSASLSFDVGGKILGINVKVGSKVKTGEILSYLDNTDLQAQLRQAEASVRAEQAELSDLKKGATTEEITVKETDVKNAKVSLEDARNGLIDKIKDSYTKSDDAVRNKIDRMFDNSRSSEPKINFVVSDTEEKSKIEFERFVIESMLNTWANSISTLDKEKDISLFKIEALTNLSKTSDFLNRLSATVNGLTATANLSQTSIDTYKSETSTARTNINTAITNIIVANEKLNTAESTLTSALDDLALIKAPVALEKIAVEEAVLEGAIANVDGIRAKISKTILRSPINGVVSQVNFEEGETVSVNTSVISVISDSEFEMEANIPEADIAKVTAGDISKVTLDAYGNDVIFEAKVLTIEPAETMIEGVATYKTVFKFNKKDSRIKSGMTANIDILTDKKEGVLIVPQRSVKVVDGEKIVLLFENGKTVERKIAVGLRGSDGMFEVVSGLVEGDKVVSIIE